MTSILQVAVDLLREIRLLRFADEPRGSSELGRLAEALRHVDHARACLTRGTFTARCSQTLDDLDAARTALADRLAAATKEHT
jgi:hypothetical protein